MLQLSPCYQDGDVQNPLACFAGFHRIGQLTDNALALQVGGSKVLVVGDGNSIQLVGKEVQGNSGGTARQEKQQDEWTYAQ